MLEAAAKDPRIRVVRLSRNFGHQGDHRRPSRA
jgi:hypothetical protein